MKVERIGDWTKCVETIRPIDAGELVSRINRADGEHFISADHHFICSCLQVLERDNLNQFRRVVGNESVDRFR